MRNFILILILLPGISLIFVYTKVNIWPFWLGFLLCLIAELCILLFYCFIKLQKAYRDSFTIKIQQNYTLNFERDYPFRTLVVGKDFYLNRFTEEARLTSKKLSLKSPEFQQQIDQIIINEVPYKDEIQQYIKQIRNKYHYLNKFNQSLIDFGIRLKNVSNNAIIFSKSYNFVENESYFKDDSFNLEFREEERRAFNELKIKLKSPKIHKHGSQLGDKKEPAINEEIVLPTWQSVMSALQKIGMQFQQIDRMRQSNSELLEMIHKKIIEDYEVLQKEISESAKNIERLRQNLESLRDEQQKLQKYETTIKNENSIDMIYWIKKQYFQFTNLSLRIKQNEKNYRIHIQKVRYYKSKLNSFFKHQKDKYDKVIFTRYLSFLDAYSITIEDALNILTEVFNQQGYKYPSEQGPPKVKEMARSRNMNEVLSAETTYQEQYLQRAHYYQQKIGLTINNLQSLDLFLSKLKNIFGEVLFNLKMEDNYSVKVDKGGRKQLKLNSKYFQPLFEQLSLQSQRIYDIVSNLQQVNQKILKDNKQQLQDMGQGIQQGCATARQILSSLNLNQGPIREKHRRVKVQLTYTYKQIEELIVKIKQFEQIYQKHQNRVKKILVVSFIQFLGYQRKMICFDNYGEYLKQLDSGDYNMEEFNLLETTNENNKFDLTAEELSLQKFNHLETGYLFSEEYKVLLNRFLFVAYTQWSNSQLFKHTISKEIYIALNEDINQSFAEIVIEDFQLSGLPPEIIWVKDLCSQQNEFMVDINISFRGKILIKISTIYLPVFNLPVELQISIEEFYSVIRLCFISNELGCSWMSFIGEPIAKVVIKPKLGEYKIDFDSIANMFQNVILRKLKETVYPIKKRIAIPLYKKDQSYEFIQNRFKTMGMV